MLNVWSWIAGVFGYFVVWIIVLFCSVTTQTFGDWIFSKKWLISGIVAVPLIGFLFTYYIYNDTITSSKGASREITLQDLEANNKASFPIVSNDDLLENEKVKSYLADITSNGTYNAHVFDKVIVKVTPDLSSEAEHNFLMHGGIDCIVNTDISIDLISKQLDLDGVLTTEVKDTVSTYKIGDTYLVRSSSSDVLNGYVNKNIHVKLTYGHKYESDNVIDQYLITDLVERGTN